MHSLITTAAVVAGTLVAWHMWLMFKSGAYRRETSIWTRCACGHAASFHSHSGGCKHTHSGSVDCYGYCTCERSAAEVEGALRMTTDERPPSAEHGHGLTLQERIADTLLLRRMLDE